MRAGRAMFPWSATERSRLSVVSTCRWDRSSSPSWLVPLPLPPPFTFSPGRVGREFITIYPLRLPISSAIKRKAPVFRLVLSLSHSGLFSNASMLTKVLWLTLLPLLAAAQDGGITGPTTSQEAAGYSCDPEKCKLPTCNCASTSPPGGLKPVRTYSATLSTVPIA